MRIIKSKKGFTLIEAMMAVAIMGVVTVGLLKMFQDGLYMWNMGTAKMAIAGEARMTMVFARKLIQECQGTTIRISRLNANQPANSMFDAILTDTVYITTTQQRCGCGSTTDVTTVGAAGEHVKLFQKDNYILATYPYVRPGTDLADNAAVKANTFYKTITITANAESLMFAFMDSKKGTSISTGVRVSKKALQNKPPVSIFLKESIVVKHMHSAGYYYN